MAKAKRPRTGEPRRTNQPLKIDKLPPDALQSILALRNGLGKTWQEIEAISAHSKAEGGFIDWENNPMLALLFPDKQLPHTSLHRWYDLRVVQVRKDVEQRSAVAREVAESFAASVVDGSDEAVLNAARDQLMALLAEDLTPGSRERTAKILINLAKTLQAARANNVRERAVAVDERRITVLEDREKAARERVDQATQHAAKKGTGQFSLEDINLLRERTFGLPPLVAENG